MPNTRQPGEGQEIQYDWFADQNPYRTLRFEEPPSPIPALVRTSKYRRYKEMCRLHDIRPETHRGKFEEHLFINPRCNQLYGVLKAVYHCLQTPQESDTRVTSTA